MKNKIISIVTTAYRTDKYIDAYFKYVSKINNLDDVRIILVVNSPSEYEMDAIEKFDYSHPDVLELITVPDRESIAASLNRGLLRCKTDYIAFLDIDDVRIPDSLSNQLNTLIQYPSIEFTYGDIIVVRSQGDTTGKLSVVPEFDSWEFTRGCYASPTQFFRSGLIEKCGMFDEQLKSGGDFDFQVRAAANCVFKKTCNAVLYYTKYPGSRSASSGHIQPLERTVVELRYGIYDKIDERYIDEAMERYRVYELYYSNGWHHVSEVVPGYHSFMLCREELKAIGKINNRHRKMQRRINRVKKVVKQFIK